MRNRVWATEKWRGISAGDTSRVAPPSTFHLPPWVRPRPEPASRLERASSDSWLAPRAISPQERAPPRQDPCGGVVLAGVDRELVVGGARVGEQLPHQADEAYVHLEHVL